MNEINNIMQRIAALRAANPRTDAEIRAWTWKNEIKPRLKSVELPERFHHRITEWPVVKQKGAYELAKSKLGDNGAIVALVGPRGTGKTTIAAQFIIEHAEAYYERPTGWPVPYCKLIDLVTRFKPVYADFGSINADQIEARRNTFCSYPLRVIDELHECDDMRNGNRVLVDVLDRCYAGRVDTVIISNQTYEDFNQKTDPSILSRISEHGIVIPCIWKSFRAPN